MDWRLQVRARTLSALVLGVAALWQLLPGRPQLAHDLKGKIAVVTGGGRGLGRGISMALVEAGATVYITGRTERSLAEVCSIVAGSGTCLYRKVDHADERQVALFFQQLGEETGGRLDILVNNAYSAIAYTAAQNLLGKPFWEVPMQLFDDVFNVGVRAVYKASVLAIPMMQKQGGGLIVNSNSPGCLFYAIHVPYGMGKCAVDKMTQDMAVELGTEKIDVVSFWPGLLQTEEVLAGHLDVGTPRRGILPGLQIAPPFSRLSSTAVGETVIFAGRAVAHLARDADRSSFSGLVVLSCQLARRYSILDERGLHSPSAFLTVKGLLTTLLPPLRDFAEVRNSSNQSATALQRFFFNTLPDVNIPVSIVKLLVGNPLTMQWPITN